MAAVMKSMSITLHKFSGRVECLLPKALPTSNLWQIASAFSFWTLQKVKVPTAGIAWCLTLLIVSSGGGDLARDSIKRRNWFVRRTIVLDCLCGIFM